VFVCKIETEGERERLGIYIFGTRRGCGRVIVVNQGD